MPVKKYKIFEYASANITHNTLDEQEKLVTYLLLNILFLILKKKDNLSYSSLLLT